MSNNSFGSPGELLPQAVYTLAEAQRRTRWGSAGFRAARRNGLVVRYIGRTAFVFGKDLIEYLDQNCTTEKPGSKN